MAQNHALYGFFTTVDRAPALSIAEGNLGILSQYGKNQYVILLFQALSPYTLYRIVCRVKPEYYWYSPPAVAKARALLQTGFGHFTIHTAEQ